MDDITLYKKNTKTSAKLFAKSAQLHVNGVSHNIRYFKPYPFVVNAASGKYLIDVDSNKYTDYWMGHWALILGHTANTKIIHNQIKKDWMYGTVNKQTIELSERLAKIVPVAEKIRYVTSGTEATMYAVRLARTITGKKIIAKIDGGWHGYTSDLLKSVNWPFSESESAGLVNERNIISIPYNNLEKSLEILQKHTEHLAGIIIEPVLGGGGCIPADHDFLRGIQEFCKKNNIPFILDEIVTGFRFRFGCLYQKMKLDPDIVTLGKIVGGGMPIGVICGKNEIMNHADASIEKSKRSYVGGGTFSANPLSMAAGLATINQLKDSTYDKINQLGDFIRAKLSKTLAGNAILTGKGSLFMTHFTDESKITNSAQAAQCDITTLYKYHFKMIAQDKIFFLPGKLGAISNAHTKNDMKKIISATEKWSNKTFIK